MPMTWGQAQALSPWPPWAVWWPLDPSSSISLHRSLSIHTHNIIFLLFDKKARKVKPHSPTSAHIYMYIYICIYIYRERESKREREKERERDTERVVDIFIYIYIYLRIIAHITLQPVVESFQYNIWSLSFSFRFWSPPSCPKRRRTDCTHIIYYLLYITYYLLHIAYWLPIDCPWCPGTHAQDPKRALGPAHIHYGWAYGHQGQSIGNQ